MKGLEFPIIGTKVKGLKKVFDLNSPQGRKEYFRAKTPFEIEKIAKFLKKGSFVAYLIGKKGSGKSTYSQIFTSLFGEDKIAFVSIGDVVRDTSADWENFRKTGKYLKLKDLYRGYISFEDACNALIGRTQSSLLPTEFVLALLKLKIEELKGKTIFIDGLPRDLDQVSYSLYFRDLIGYRDDPDMFILIDIPESVIDARMKNRVVCPKCHLSRSLHLLPTNKVGYDKKTKDFYLICDNPDCAGAGIDRLIQKEGDEKGIESIRGRLVKDEEILKKAFALHGVPKILLRNHVARKDAKKYFDDYEITPEYNYSLVKGKVKITEKPWSIKDDNGVDSVSLLSAPVVIALLKQMADILEV